MCDFTMTANYNVECRIKMKMRHEGNRALHYVWTKLWCMSSLPLLTLWVITLCFCLFLYLYALIPPPHSRSVMQVVWLWNIEPSLPWFNTVRLIHISSLFDSTMCVHRKLTSLTVWLPECPFHVFEMQFRFNVIVWLWTQKSHYAVYTF